MNPDIARERSKASFKVEELTNILDGGKEKTHRRRYLENIISRDPEFEKSLDIYMDRAQMYEMALQRGLRYHQVKTEHNFTDPEDLYILRRTIDRPMAFGLNDIMFIPSIQSMGTEEQQAKWIPPAKNYSIIGTYAQTELGHGTNIKALQTTATYDKARQEFVMHSPQLSACKWWPGNLAHSTTHAIIVAQLIVDGQSHGIQFFMVQLRDLKDHKPMPGITIGDIGPKPSLYMNGNDNGFLLLNHVRIPRENMLMAKTKVSPDGKVSKSGNSKALYGTMMFVRATIPMDISAQTAKAITIAIRYGAVRRQSELKPGAGEIQILDFKTQQYKLLPNLAATYTLKFASRRVIKEFYDFKSELKNGNDSRVQEMHSITSSLKAFSTSQALQCAQTCRLCCGGHGYSLLSALPELYNIIDASCTYEGENTVLFLQVARYLLKCVNKHSMGEGNLPSSVAYLGVEDNGENIPVFSMDQFLNSSIQLQIVQMQSRRLILTVAKKMQSQLMMNEMEHMDAWNANSPDFVKCAQSHSFYLMVSYCMDFLQTGLRNASNSVRNVLKSLCDLYVLNGIIENSGRYLEVGVLNATQIGLIKDQVELLIDDIRPDAVALVDAFDFSDYIIGSALGKYNGNVYEELYNWAQKSPLNKEKVRPGYHKYLKPFLQHGKSKL